MGMYDTFETDKNLEQEGVWIDYGEFRVRIASAGPGNKEYAKYAEKKLKPVRKVMEAGALTNERSAALMADIYSKTIVKGWQILKDGEWVDGIEGRDGSILDVTPENIQQVFRDLPTLFLDIQEQAMALVNFRRAELESEAKN